MGNQRRRRSVEWFKPPTTRKSLDEDVDVAAAMDVDVATSACSLAPQIATKHSEASQKAAILYLVKFYLSLRNIKAEYAVLKQL